MPDAPPSGATGADPEQEERAKLKKTFDSFDSDGSGEVSIEEITQLLISLGVSASTETIMACVKEADTDNSGEISFEEFYAAMRKSGHAGADGGNGYGLHNSTFADLVRDATNAEDIGRTIEEANTRFLSTYNDLVVDIISSCQTEVLAAKVPLASYGRVKSALDTVTAELTGTAQDVLRKEFLQLRSSTIEFLTAQKLQLEESFKSRVNTGIDNIKRDAEKQVKEADKRTKLAEASVKKIEARFSEPQALVAKLEAQAQEANDKAVALEAKLAKYTDDWSEVYPKITALCSIQMHHAYRFAPILEVLTQRGIASAKQFYEKMDVKGDGKVTKQDFIQNMRSLGLSAEHLGDHELGQVFSDMDVDHSGTLSFKEVAAALQRWKRVHIPDSKSTKPRADDWMAKAFKSLAPEALGSRMLYLVQCYEENIRAREEKHTLEETISKEELVGKDAEWEKERKQLKAAKEEMETMLASERAEHLAEVTKLKETIEAASSKQTKTDKEDIDDLKKLIKKKQAEVDDLGEKLRSATAELKSTSQAKDSAGQEHSQLLKQRDAEIASYEARLHSVLTALAKAKAAQPRHGGYYFAAAPLVSRSIMTALSPSRSSSREASPTRSLDGAESGRSFSSSPTPSPIRQFFSPLRNTSASRESSPSHYGPGYSPGSAASQFSPQPSTPSSADKSPMTRSAKSANRRGGRKSTKRQLSTAKQSR